MGPFSYTSLKIVHDEKIQEALERQRFDAEQDAQRQGLLQAFRKLFARFNNSSDQKQREPFPGCAW